MSEATKDQCLRRGVRAERVVVIPNGVTPFKSVETTTDLARKADGKTILAVGRQVKRKGFDWFLEEVFPDLASRFQNVRLVLIGNGPLHRRLRVLAKRTGYDHRITFLTDVDDETLSLLYQQADLVVMPNLPVRGDMEGFGMAAAEALVAGRPVVAAKCDGLRYTIPTNDIGILVRPGDSEGFIRAISDLLSNDARAIEMGKRAQAYALRSLSWERAARSYELVFQGVAQDGRY